MHDKNDLLDIESARNPYLSKQWSVGPLIAGETKGTEVVSVINPAVPSDKVGEVHQTSLDDVEAALAGAVCWQVTAAERATILVKASELFESNLESFSLCSPAKQENSHLTQLRSYVKRLIFCAITLHVEKYYRNPARGIIACVSPWNFR